MLLTLTTTNEPATDLGFLLHKHPDQVRTVDLPFGRATVFWPQADAARATVCLLVDVDPVGLVRRRKGPPGDAPGLDQYVNDRPYVASSFLSVAIGKLFGTALTGRSEVRPELADAGLPLEIHLPVLPCRGGEPVLRRLFEPLGYTVDATPIPLDEHFPAWGPSRYFDVELQTSARVADVLSQLCVLLPVLDDAKHYWVGKDEIDKLLRRGGDWLPAHPEHELITRRFLRHDRHLTREALARLVGDDSGDVDALAERADAEEEAVERPVSLNEQRLDAVVAAVIAAHAQRVVDLGCGEGRLLQRLLRERDIARVTGVDVSWRALERAGRRLHVDRMTPRERERLELWQGSLTYRDKRLAAFDAACLVEVIEHLDEARLYALERVVFADARPPTVIVTTPNVEYNVRFETLPAGELRHRDHRFEWTRAEFGSWANAVATRRGYDVTFSPVGTVDDEVGPPTQMAVFIRRESEAAA